MRHIPVLAVLLGAAALSDAAMPAQAQRSRAPTDIQKDYDQFIVKFRTALKVNDGGVVPEMTKFPFYWDEMRDAAYFRKNLYSKIFPAKGRRCLATGKGTYARAPDGSNNFTVFCGEELYIFTKTPNGFRFAETGVND